jgi:hypothetical protein
MHGGWARHRWTDPREAFVGASIAIERPAIRPRQAVLAVRAMVVDQNFGK